jgi:chemotaxis protein CheD
MGEPPRFKFMAQAAANSATRPTAMTLLPGQWHFGTDCELKTLLGSCVAITLWHPIRKMGGMCHYLLPSRARKANDALDGRYGDEALELMVQKLRVMGVQPRDFHAHLYGGADTMPDGVTMKFNVGERNIEQGWKLLDEFGFQLQGIDVGDNVPRTVTLKLPEGEVTMVRGQAINSNKATR